MAGLTRPNAADAAEVLSFAKEHSGDDEVVRSREWTQVDPNPNPEMVLVERQSRALAKPHRRGRCHTIQVFRRAR